MIKIKIQLNLISIYKNDCYNEIFPNVDRYNCCQSIGIQLYYLTVLFMP